MINAPLQFQISALDYSSYVGRIGIGRIKRGRVKPGQQVLVMFGTEEEAAEHERTPIRAKIGQVFGYMGLNKVELDEGQAGDIVQITGIEDLVLGCTVTDPENPETLPLLQDRRADAGDAVHGQYQPARRHRRQVRHQPPDPRAPAQGTADQHGAARA